jgi:hypothetical protein
MSSAVTPSARPFALATSLGLFASATLIHSTLTLCSSAHAPAAAVEALVRQLGDEDFEKREEAGEELRAVGRAALPRLQKAAANDADVEVRRRAGALIEEIDAPAIALRKRGGVVEADESKPDVPVTRADLFGMTDIVEGDFKALHSFPALRELVLSGPAVTDQALSHVLRLRSLSRLTLAGTAITEEGMSGVCGLRGLTYLSLARTPVTDKGIRDVARLEKLQVFVLANTKITDDGLAAVAGCKQLIGLSLAETAITDGGLRRLASLEHLRILDLSGTKITADGLVHLKKCRELEILVLPTHIPQKAVEELSKELPKLKRF